MQRVEQDILFDIVKGLGILLVVFGHACGYAWGWENLPRRVIYMFHMPLFFFVSGVFASRIQPFIPEFRKVLVGLGIPFVFYLVIGLAVEMLNPAAFSWSKFIFSIYNGHPYVNGPLCFLVVTACTRMIISSCPKVLNQLGGWGMLLISLILMFVPADILNSLPLMIGVWPLALFFVCLGWNCVKVRNCLRLMPRWAHLLIFVGLMTLIALRAQFYGLTAIASNSYPDKLWIVFAIFGVVAMTCLSECVGRVAYVRDAIAFLGRNSLYVFALDLVASRLEWNAMMKFNISVPIFFVLIVHLSILIASIKPCKFMIDKITPKRLLKA